VDGCRGIVLLNCPHNGVLSKFELDWARTDLN
jgi:hypothetical protein